MASVSGMALEPQSLLERATDNAREKLDAAMNKLRGDKAMFEKEAAEYKQRAIDERREANKIHA